MTLFDPSVSIFVGDDKFTGNAYEHPSLPKDSSPNAPVTHYEVPVHVVLPFEMCDALHRGKESKFLENLQLRLGNDVYTLSGRDILDAKTHNSDVIILKDHQHVNMLDSSRPPVYHNLEVDLSYIVDAVSNNAPQGDIKVPLVVRVPSERPADVNKIAILWPRDLTQEATEVDSPRRGFDSLMPHSQYTLYTPRDGPDHAVPELFTDPTESVQTRARTLLTRGAIPDDISGIDNYRPPPLDLKKGGGGGGGVASRQPSAMRMSVRSFNSNPSGVSKYTNNPSTRFNRYSGRVSSSLYDPKFTPYNILLDYLARECSLRARCCKIDIFFLAR